MPIQHVILFDDGRGQLAPLTDLRAAFDVRTGALTTLERVQLLLGRPVTHVFVPSHLEALTRERHPGIGVNIPPPAGAAGGALVINARWPAAAPVAKLPIADGAGPLLHGDVLVDPASNAPVYAEVEVGDVARVVRGELSGLRARPLAADTARPTLIARPWHVRTYRDACLDADLAMLRTETTHDVPAGVLLAGEKRLLCIHSTARICPGVVLDTESGPIHIADGATIRPGAIIIGPAYIGPHSTVLERTLIKAHTAIGPWCKVAGEVGGTIFQGFANKAHDGHLGDSYIGEWANLGAGTTNSNLLNTYSEVVSRATPGGPNERTGETFLGCIVGDHAKFAICTRIMTGAVVHTGAMWAATAAVAGCVPAFSWNTAAGVKGFRLDKFVEIARTVMARRKITPSEAYLDRLAVLHHAATSSR